jgi:hypothetical protein
MVYEFLVSFFFLWGKLHDKTHHKMQVKRKKIGRRRSGILPK